jgi:hypothetical protein
MIAIVKKAHYEETAHIIKLNTQALQNIAFLQRDRTLSNKVNRTFSAQLKKLSKH